MHAYIYVRTYVCLDTCAAVYTICLDAHIRTRVRIRMYACIYVRMHVCMYVWTESWPYIRYAWGVRIRTRVRIRMYVRLRVE
jgi:hypothetical protein